MQLIQNFTDLDRKDALILQVAEAAHHLASVLATTNEIFWSFPTDRLLDVLNADIPATLATFAANTALATAVNASLDALDLPQFSRRATTKQGRTDIVFDHVALFFYHNPPEIKEPIIEPIIEPIKEA